jgi:RNA polymerase sigma-70 factor (ECF subfamily)
MEKQSDVNLVRACIEGDKRAFEILIDRYQKTLFNIALNMVKDYEDAKDVTQNVFIKAYENLDGFREEFKFFSWIYRIAVNECINFIGKRKNFKELEGETVSRYNNPEEEFIMNEFNEKIMDAISELPMDYRLAIIFRHFASLPYRDISFILDIPEKKVKSRLFTARKLLGEIFQKQGILSYGR